MTTTEINTTAARLVRSVEMLLGDLDDAALVNGFLALGFQRLKGQHDDATLHAIMRAVNRML